MIFWRAICLVLTSVSWIFDIFTSLDWRISRAFSVLFSCKMLSRPLVQVDSKKHGRSIRSYGREFRMIKMMVVAAVQGVPLGKDDVECTKFHEYADDSGGLFNFDVNIV